MPNQLTRYNRYAPYARALVTGLGIAYRNRRLARDVGQGLRRAYDDFRAGKPPVESVAKRQAVMPVTAGATNVIQRAVIKQKSGKRVRRKSVNYLFRLSKASTSTAILRFQNMTPYDTNGGLPAGYDCYGGATGARAYAYPVFIFDITSARFNANGVALGAEPMYRLLSGITGDFEWSAVGGQAPDGSTITNEWRSDTGRGADSLINSPSFGNTSMLAWSDIRLALYGATNQTTRFNVSFIQFVDEVFQPRAARANPAVPATLNADVQDQQGRFNAAMEELVKPLVFHPMHAGGNAQGVYRVLSSRSFSVQPDTQTNEGKASPNVCYKLFKRMNRICKWNWQTSDKRATTAVTSTEHKINPEANGGLDTAPDFNQFFGGTKKPYVHPNARVYMMITAQAYTRTGIQPDGSNVAISPVNTPSMDILVRNKWLYDAV